MLLWSAWDVSVRGEYVPSTDNPGGIEPVVKVAVLGPATVLVPDVAVRSQGSGEPATYLSIS
jgi:hypothetical protein